MGDENSVVNLVGVSSSDGQRTKTCTKRWASVHLPKRLLANQRTRDSRR